MKPAKFNFLAPQDLGEVLACLNQYGAGARILAGGLSLGAMLNYRLVDFSVLIDISNLKELSYIRRDGDWVEIGAATTQAELLAWSELAETLPLLALALPFVGHYQTRSRGTVCGSISHCEPTSELPLCFRLLNGEAVLRSKHGERRLAAGDFQRGMFSNACRPDEMVVAVRFPVCTSIEGYAFREFAQRRGDFAIVAIAAVAATDKVRVAVGGVTDRPHIQEWRGLAEQDYDDELNKLAWTLGGYTDIHADAAYRRGLVRTFGRQVIEEARNNAAT
jgi:2-furoyl-CoA dehydrogenase FAD binding subunit